MLLVSQTSRIKKVPTVREKGKVLQQLAETSMVYAAFFSKVASMS
jgi:hypothetical protein